MVISTQTRDYQVVKSKMQKYLVTFAQTKEEFRVPELIALGEYFQTPVLIEEGAYNPKSPYMVVGLEDDEAARKILSRAILIREIIQLFAKPASKLDSIHQEIKSADVDVWVPYRVSSFKFDVESYGRRIPGDEKTVIINSFAYSNLDGDIKMHGAEVIFALRVDRTHTLYYFGRLVGESRRDLMERFNLKKRSYLGITSFEAELSLVMSNLALVGPGKLVLDPFVGTGSFLYTTSAFGAYSIGSDIDGRQLRGTSECNFYQNLKQYQVEKFVLGGLVQDIKHHAFRDGFKVDAIVTDPPYGVRAGAKMIGGFDNDRPNQIPKDPVYRSTRYPKTIPYEMSELVKDLFEFGAKFLNPKGRLLFWFPVEKDQVYEAPRDPRFRPVAECLQECRDFDRWLIIAELN